MEESEKNPDSLDYYDLWKYCNDVGGRDKDRMITIVTWHFGYVILIIGYVLSNSSQTEPVNEIILSGLSVLICLISIYWIYAYASYANRYWNIADRCEEHVKGLKEFTNKCVYRDLLKNARPQNIGGRIDVIVLRYLLKETRDSPEKGLLPPFRILLIVAIIMILVSTGICIYSICV